MSSPSNNHASRKSMSPYHKPAAAPKNVEWGVVSRSLNVTMTSMLQKMGKAEATQSNPQLVIDNMKVKILKLLYDDTINRSKKVVKKTQSLIQSVNPLKQSLQELATYLSNQGKDPCLLTTLEVDTYTAKSIESILNIHQEIANFREKQHSSISNRFILPAEAFVTNTLGPAREAKNRYRKARLEFDSASSKLKISQAQKELDLKQLYISQSNYAKYKMRFNHREYEALTKLSDTNQRHNFEYLVQSINLLASLHDYYSNVCSSLNAMEPTIKEMRDFSAQQKKTNQDNRQDQQLKLYEISREKDENKYNELVEIFSSPDLAVVNAICLSSGSEQEVILEDLVRILDAHKQTLPIIKLGITKEIGSTSTAATLFRGNSTPTKLMTSFTKLTGRPYLISTLKPAIDRLLKDPSGYELDPEKSSGTAGAAERLTNMCQEMLDDIYNSINACPLPFREMANHLQNEVVKVFPESKHTSVGGFIFLRFFCPCILSPDSCGVTDSASLTMEARRALLLCSKTLQNLSNGLLFGAKEPWMKEMNPFLERNMETFKDFLDKVAEVPLSTDYKPLSSIAEVKSSELPSIHKILTKNLEKIFKTLCQYNQQSVTFQLVSALGKLGDAVE